MIFIPYYEHDCEHCIYLGSDSVWEVDYYYHPNNTALARYGNEEAYTSGLGFYKLDFHINRAVNLALAWNLLTFEELQKHVPHLSGITHLAH